VKRCPHCSRNYDDDSLSFCLDDGASLSVSPGLEKTLVASGRPDFNLPPTTPAYSSLAASQPNRSPFLLLALGSLALILLAALIAGAALFLYYRGHQKPQPITYADGTRYEGGVMDGKPDGRGIMIFPSGDVYDGEFGGGRRNGQGVFTFHDGTRYTGQFKNDDYNGHGKMTFPNSDVYDGEFRDGKYNGQGVFTFHGGTKYRGQFKNGVYDGRGIMTFSNGDVYDGEFRDGTYNGQGTFTFHDGRRQEGTWADGKFVEPS
jgi:hypothetical protein